MEGGGTLQQAGSACHRVTIYYKQRRYHIEIGETHFNKMLSREELVQKNKKWKKKDKIIILIMDANEYLNKVK